MTGHVGTYKNNVLSRMEELNASTLVLNNPARFSNYVDMIRERRRVAKVKQGRLEKFGLMAFTEKFQQRTRIVFGAESGCSVDTLSLNTGMWAVGLLMRLCREVHVYGFTLAW